MTACVNNEKKMKGGALTGKAARLVLAGALAVSLTPSLAYAVEDGGSDAYAAAAEASDSFAGGTFAWNVEEAEDGVLQVPAGTTLTLTSAKDAFGNPISVSDCTVAYFAASAGEPNGDVVKADSLVAGTDYVAVVVKGAVTIANASDLEGKSYAKQPFKIVKKSLAGAFAYEGKDVTDTTFKYDGDELEINFADADGNKLESGTDYTALTGPDFTNAGTHTVVLTAPASSDYEGSVMVTYTIDAIDLAKDEIAIEPVKKGGSEYASGAINDKTIILVNGSPLETGAEVVATVEAGIKADGTKLGDPDNYGGTNAASLVLTLTGTEPNVVNSKTGVAASVVEDLATFYYGDDEVDSDFEPNFTAGETFDAAQLTAWVGTKQVTVSSVKVTKDGAEVTEWSQPGTYSVTATVDAASDLSYAGSANFDFTVQGKVFSEQPKAYVSIDGKDAKSVEYTGEAVVPTILVKDGSTTLTEGEDYEVVYTVADTDEKVDAMVEPGKYDITVDFGDNAYYKDSPVPGAGTTAVNDITVQDFEITKAQLRSAKADKEVYAYTGEAVTPLFTAYTKADLSGFSVEIDPSAVAVTYHKAAVDSEGEPVIVGYKADGTEATAVTDADVVYTGGKAAGAAVTASQVKDEGFYVATVYAPVDDKHIEGSVKGILFEVSKTAGFSDVSSSDWFADPVYKAKELGYINGIQGTTLFAPNAAIDRAQIAAIMFNMAGGQSSEAGSADENEYPTKFSDVDQTAWYAQAVAWASTYGVVSGYEGTDLFGTFDKATREQVAAMFYNYAKAMGQDVSVADADAALAAYSDGAEVDAWARTAVAWAVENGVMGNGEQLWPLAQISRAEVAAMAVNFQPEKL